MFPQTDKMLFLEKRLLTYVCSCVAPLILVLFSPLLAQEPAGIFINQAIQDYDGNPKFPLVSTDPPGLSVGLEIFPRSQAETVFSSIPDILVPSYESLGLNGLSDNAFGEELDLGGSSRVLESIEVGMVNFARSSSWPDLAAVNPDGYLHPLSVIVYEVNNDALTELVRKTVTTLVPWRPENLDDGGDYPFSGRSFRARFTFTEEITLSGRLAVFVAYNTQSSGFEPLGEAGPFNSLSVAFPPGNLPTIGSDVNPSRALRFRSGISRSGAFGSRSPMFVVNAFSTTPSNGTPLDAGGYLVKATVTEPGFEGEKRGEFIVRPLERNLVLADLEQVADGSGKEVSVVSLPAGSELQAYYVGSNGLPVERGLYPVFAQLAPGNYTGQISGTMRLGYSFQTWINGQVGSGAIPANLAGQNDDPDNDGRVNLLEYFAGSLPGTAESTSSAVLNILQNEVGGLTFDFRRNREAVDIGFRLESTLDLASPEAWTPVVLPASSPFSPDLIETIQLALPIEPEVNAEFFRLRLEMASP